MNTRTALVINVSIDSNIEHVLIYRYYPVCSKTWKT